MFFSGQQKVGDLGTTGEDEIGAATDWLKTVVRGKGEFGKKIPRSRPR
jgi:hypothetical protein